MAVAEPSKTRRSSRAGGESDTAFLQAPSGSGLVAMIELAASVALPGFERYLKNSRMLRRR